MVDIATVHVAILGLSAAVTAGLGAHAARSRGVPGRVPFALLMGAVGLWCGVYALGLVTPDPTLRVALEALTWLGRGTVPVWILLFALAYTGYDQFVTPRTVAALLAYPLATVGLLWTYTWHDLMWTTIPRVVFFEGMALVVAGVGPAYWAYIVYAYVLITAGAVLLVRLVVASEYLYADQSALLVLGIAAPFVANAVTVFPPHPVPGFDYTPYGFTVTGIAFGYALFRAHLFDLVPATRALGREAAVAQIDAGVVVVDAERRIIYCNHAASDVFDCDPADVLGLEVAALVDEERLDFDAEDALAELERDDSVYEIRTAPVTDRRDRPIGHTLVIHDVTARKTRERELARLDEVNSVIRGVNQSLVAATGRDEIERSLCERLLEADSYRRACVADVRTWAGDAEGWSVAPDGGGQTPPALDDGALDSEVFDSQDADAVRTVDADGGTWALVPLVHGRTLHGVLGLYTDRETVPDRERTVLRELGETVGDAIDAAETRQLLSADRTVQVELECRDADAPLVAATAASPGRLAVRALVPRGDGSRVAYLRATGVSLPAVRDHLATGPDSAVRPVSRDAVGDSGTTGASERGEDVASADGRDGDVASGDLGDGDVGDGDVRDVAAVLEWQLGGESLLGTLAGAGAHVRGAEATDGVASCDVELASHADVRSLVETVRRRYPETTVVAKRERDRAVETGTLPTTVTLDGLTDRQREVLEVAYRAGYFDWPRESSGQDVAETLDITSPTLQAHLRKAQKRLLDDVFDPDAED